MEELDADVPTCSNSLTATEADAALRKQKRKKHKMKLAEKSRRKVEKYIE
uniref:Uncharacterized protein n=1 Tax=Plectus sambesii TaxID=2011161 RepID=A0A914VHW3_9BILA